MNCQRIDIGFDARCVGGCTLAMVWCGIHGLNASSAVLIYSYLEIIYNIHVERMEVRDRLIQVRKEAFSGCRDPRH